MRLEMPIYQVQDRLLKLFAACHRFVSPGYPVVMSMRWTCSQNNQVRRAEVWRAYIGIRRGEIEKKPIVIITIFEEYRCNLGERITIAKCMNKRLGLRLLDRIAEMK